MFHESKREGHLVSTDPGRLNLGVIHGFLKKSYWAQGVTLEVIERSVENPLCFGLYEGEEQIGFARMVTDRATFAYLANVLVLEEHRGGGLGGAHAGGDGAIARRVKRATTWRMDLSQPVERREKLPEGGWRRRIAVMGAFLAALRLPKRWSRRPRI